MDEGESCSEGCILDIKKLSDLPKMILEVNTEKEVTSVMIQPVTKPPVGTPRRAFLATNKVARYRG